MPRSCSTGNAVLLANVCTREGARVEDEDRLSLRVITRTYGTTLNPLSINHVERTTRPKDGTTVLESWLESINRIYLYMGGVTKGTRFYRILYRGVGLGQASEGVAQKKWVELQERI